jgi:hypothetical protein
MKYGKNLRGNVQFCAFSHHWRLGIMGCAQSGSCLSVVLSFETVTYSFIEDAKDEIIPARNRLSTKNTVEEAIKPTSIHNSIM